MSDKPSLLDLFLSLPPEIERNSKTLVLTVRKFEKNYYEVGYESMDDGVYRYGELEDALNQLHIFIKDYGSSNK